MNEVARFYGGTGGLVEAIGSALEQKHKDEIRPLTDTEQKTRKWGLFLALAILSVGVLVLFGMLVFTGVLTGL